MQQSLISVKFNTTTFHFPILLVCSKKDHKFYVSRVGAVCISVVFIKVLAQNKSTLFNFLNM